MPKTQLKSRKLRSQQGLDAITGAPLPTNLALVDTDRIVPRLDGGTYDDDENVRVTDPVVHQQRHGTYCERPPSLAELKSLFDDRVQVMRLALKINNQLLAFARRTDHAHPETETFLAEQVKVIKTRLSAIDRVLAEAISNYDDPLVKAALDVKGLGPITVAALTVYVDLRKAPNASSLWQYVGLDRPSHQRYERNPEQQQRREARGAAWYGGNDAVPTGWGGNKVLRTVLWNTANVLMKLGEGPYRLVYDRTKARLEQSQRPVMTRLANGSLVERTWETTKPSHRHGAALRAVMKHLLADYWFVGRELAGLPTNAPYAGAMLGHEHIVSPREREWKW